MESEPKLQIDIDDYKPVILSQQSKNESPLFNDPISYVDNLENTLKKQTDIKNQEQFAKDGMLSFTQE